MPETPHFTIVCPCCDATLVVDAHTGAIISHQEKAKPVASFDEMKKDLDRQKQLRDQLFSQEMGSVKDRERLLDCVIGSRHSRARHRNRCRSRHAPMSSLLG